MSQFDVTTFTSVQLGLVSLTLLEDKYLTYYYTLLVKYTQHTNWTYTPDHCEITIALSLVKVYTYIKGVNMFLELNIRELSNLPIKVNTANISSINGNVIKMNNCDILTLTNESLHTLLLSIAPKSKINNNEPKAELLELFEKLHTLTGGKGKPVFSLQREKKLSDLLTKHRMTKELLIKAATNIGKDAFLQGDNDSKKRYGDVDYLLRPDKAAKWAEDQTEKKKGMF